MGDTNRVSDISVDCSLRCASLQRASGYRQELSGIESVSSSFDQQQGNVDLSNESGRLTLVFTP
jgi:hypothetical protein